MPAPLTARDVSARGQGLRAGAEPRIDPSSSLALIGIASVLLGVPLAVVGEATGPYDDPKAWALPILMALTGVGWVARLWRTGSSNTSGPAPLGKRLVWGSVLSCTAWSLVATTASVAPGQSALGTFGRGMGLLAIVSVALAFFVIQSECRRPVSVRWLVDVALLGSVPVCVMAFGQAVGWDPLPKSWDPAVQTLTVRSTLGTHVFLGAYLVLLIPLTVARLEWEVRERTSMGSWPSSRLARRRHGLGAAWVAGAVTLIGAGSRWPSTWWLLVPWGLLGAVAMRHRADDGESLPRTRLTSWLLGGLLTVQVLIVVLSRARGALFGMLVGIGVTGFAMLIRRRAWKTVAVGALGVAALAVFLVLLNRPGSAIAPLAKVPLLSRLGDISNVERGSPGWVRVQLWKGIFDGWSRQLSGEMVVPEAPPRLRSFIGYGPETQLIVLEPLASRLVGYLSASGEGWSARYVFDRSHNVLLDRLITEGLIGVGLWTLLLASLVAVGVARIRASASAGETALRVGGLGAVLGHLAEGQVGIATPVLLLSFWMAAGLLTTDSWALATVHTRAPREERSGKRWWGMALVAAALVTLLVGWVSTRWLLASIAYAHGVRLGIAGQLSQAQGEFRRSLTLAPWLPLPVESAAYTGLRLATAERDPVRRSALLHEAEALVRKSRDLALGGPGSWALTGQIALAEARNGEPSQLPVSRDAFAAALRFRPGDPRLLAQFAWVWLESGDAPKARHLAEQALALEPNEWMAWAVLTRALKAQGDAAGAVQATGRARGLAPPEALPLLDALLR